MWQPVAKLVLLALFGTAAGLRRRGVEVKSIAMEMGVIDFRLPSCEVDKLTPEHFGSAQAHKKSGSGNMGGVHFFDLSAPTPGAGSSSGCIVVVKPRVDLTDLYAMELGKELHAPVVEARTVNGNDGGFLDAVTSAIKRIPESKGGGDQFSAIFRESWSQGCGGIELMKLGLGKDPIDYTLGIDRAACEACMEARVADRVKVELEEKINSRIVRIVDTAKKLKPLDSEATELQRTIHKQKMGSLGPVLQAMGLELTGDTNLPTKVEQWLRDESNRDKPGHPAVKESLTPSRMESIRRSLQNCESRLGAAPGQTKEEMQEVRQKMQSVLQTRGTQETWAQLAAFVSIIGEHDNVPAVGSWVSNLHNIMVSGDHGAMGIDIAVGGANRGADLRGNGTGSEPVDPAEWRAFLLHSARLAGTCAATSTVEESNLAKRALEQLALKLRFPSFNGDPFFHKEGRECQVNAGSLISQEHAEGIAKKIHARTGENLRAHIKSAEQAIQTVDTRLKSLNFASTRVDIVTGWLRHRVDAVKEVMADVDKVCPESQAEAAKVPPSKGTPQLPTMPEMPKTPPKGMPQVINCGPAKTGFKWVWHTVETMWKQTSGNWMGTRTTDVQAIPCA